MAQEFAMQQQNFGAASRYIRADAAPLSSSAQETSEEVPLDNFRIWIADLSFKPVAGVLFPSNAGRASSFGAGLRVHFFPVQSPTGFPMAIAASTGRLAVTTGCDFGGQFEIAASTRRPATFK